MLSELQEWIMANISEYQHQYFTPHHPVVEAPPFNYLTTAPFNATTLRARERHDNDHDHDDAFTFKTGDGYIGGHPISQVSVDFKAFTPPFFRSAC